VATNPVVVIRVGDAEGTEQRPARAEAFAYDRIDGVDARDARAHEVHGFSDERELQAVEDEPFDKTIQHDRSLADTRQECGRAGDRLTRRVATAQDLYEWELMRWVHGMSHHAA